MKLLTATATLLLPAGMLITNYATIPNQEFVEPQPLPPMSISTSSTQLPEYPLHALAKHSIREDCWVTATGMVYDITTFIPNNSLDQKVMSRCGKDITTFIADEHPPLSHELSRYEIGTLVP